MRRLIGTESDSKEKTGSGSNKIAVIIITNLISIDLGPVFGIQVFRPNPDVQTRTWCSNQSRVCSDKIRVFRPDLGVPTGSGCSNQIPVFRPDPGVQTKSGCSDQILVFKPDPGVQTRSVCSDWIRVLRPDPGVQTRSGCSDRFRNPNS